MSRSSLVTEEVCNWSERTTVGLGSLSLLELLINEVSDELLGLKLGEVDVGSSKLLVVDDLPLHEVWECDKERVTPWGQHLTGLGIILIELLEKFESFIVGVMFSEDIIELKDKVLVGGNVCKKTFGDQYATVVFTQGGSVLNEISNSSDDVWKGLTSIGTLLGDDNHVWMSLESALKSKMGWISTHKSNEVPVLDG